MAKNNKEKIKIIREFVNAPFKEIKKEKEESLEEEVEEEATEETSDFTEFISSSEAGAPVLRPTAAETEPLETELENAPAARTANITPAAGDAKVYNLPDYGTATYEIEAGAERQKIGIRSEEAREQGALNLTQADRQFRETWLENKEVTEDDVRRYKEMKRTEGEEERRLPFRREMRKRERILK